ncbi:MAG: hypothetical protein HY669_01185 [Chloroflexi bacterium]|nr:hypothetical protein [Chloroflexota bacterium]
MPAYALTAGKIKPGQMDAAREFGRSVNDRLLKLPGIIGWGWAETGESEIMLIAVYKDAGSAEGAAPVVQGFFADLVPMLAAPPQRQVVPGEWFTP